MNTLNDVIAKQDRQLAVVSRKVELLKEQLEQHGGGGGSDSTGHEPPPHY